MWPGVGVTESLLLKWDTLSNVSGKYLDAHHVELGQTVKEGTTLILLSFQAVTKSMQSNNTIIRGMSYILSHFKHICESNTENIITNKTWGNCYILHQKWRCNRFFSLFKNIGPVLDSNIVKYLTQYFINILWAPYFVIWHPLCLQNFPWIF